MPSAPIGRADLAWAGMSTSELLHHDNQVHATVNPAVDEKDACGSERADGERTTCAVNVVQGWHAWLYSGHGCAAGGPGAVLEHVLDMGIVDEQQFGAFGNKHHVLHKGESTHMDGRFAIARGTGLRVGSHEECDQAHPD